MTPNFRINYFKFKNESNPYSNSMFHLIDIDFDRDACKEKVE